MEHLNLEEPTLETVDMHTCGEPTRIVVKGYPTLQGTLLEQRRQAARKYDHLRRRLMLEPRGHQDMYGAILVHETELVSSGEADIGVMFCHCEGYSLMCGHGTIALGRFLIDTHDPTIFPRREQLKVDADNRTTSLNLHAPCGLVQVTVPTTANGKKADGSRPVSFISVPAFTTALSRSLPIRYQDLWPALQKKYQEPPYYVKVDVSYGGTFFCLVPLEELGFDEGLENLDLDMMKNIASTIKNGVLENFPDTYQHPSLSPDQCELYSVIFTDAKSGKPAKGSAGAELGLCIFADGQIDRSPTGSGVTARVAASYAKGERKPGVKWTYHSLVSYANQGSGAFIASITSELDLASEPEGVTPAVIVRVEGQASYLGSSKHICERQDKLGRGFLLKRSHAPVC
ncbi:MAG: hypothetical protein M1821_003468 [Bathelium mastoideum]|nr:MAG: hypothetical protein M1821_003468 [Bathelium mastoideum]